MTAVRKKIGPSFLKRDDHVSRAVVDFVRCSYLGRDNHPDVTAGARPGARSHYRNRITKTARS
ncbi:MAG: hypothetical protein EOS57_18070 [Mesorhizobium sp.]|nr:hypothetical protein EOA78_33995 [Mesorhizobium sp. M5C.F.Cr.IN.023.01.1.1]RWD17330.1 MAG: hypothetical protein EOS57_18070 [Mesorhizobium sp.]